MFTPLSNEDYAQKIESSEQAVLLCHKKLCPHCKNMHAVLGKFGQNMPGIVFYTLDNEENAEPLKTLGVERVPTILVIKNGKVAAKTSGLMNPREFAVFYAKA